MKKLWNKIKNLAKKAWTMIKKACKKLYEVMVETAEWATKHPEAVLLATSAMSLGVSGFKALRKTKVQKEQDYQRTHIYDYSLGHHWTLRRELNTTEMKEFSKRRASGESVCDILESMRVLA